MLWYPCVLFTLYVYVKLNGLEKSNQQKKQYQPKTVLFLYRSSIFFISFAHPHTHTDTHTRCLFCYYATCYLSSLFACVYVQCSLFVDFVFQYVKLFFVAGVVVDVSYVVVVCLKKATTNMDGVIRLHNHSHSHNHHRRR